MGLNLDSLKNLSTPATKVNDFANIPIPSKEAVIETIYTPLKTEFGALENITPISEDVSDKKNTLTGPKISLTNLKKASGIHTVERVQKEEKITASPRIFGSIQEPEDIPTHTSTEPDVTKIATSVVLSKKAKSVSISIPDNILITSKMEEITKKDKDQSEVIQQTIEEKSVPKEFFPNLHISTDAFLDDDIKDFITIKDSSEPITWEAILVEPLEILGTVKDKEAVDIIIADTLSPIVSDELPTISTEPSAEVITTTEGIVSGFTPTPKYIEEVKTELSGQRRAGFRFFIQHKVKILAGMSIVVSVSAIALFSGSFLSGDLLKYWKTDIQGIPVQIIQEIEPIVVIDANTGAISTGYEAWRDYSITKNTKKNIQKRNTLDTSSGITLPTP